MNWQVIWVPSAEQDLAAAWLSAPDRDAVTAAAHQIDQRLQTDPDQQGESRPQGRRILFEPPLGVLSKVRPRTRTVYVLGVWRFR